MGSAFTAISDNADAPFWNPAGLSRNKYEHTITTMQTRLSTDANHYYLSYVRPALGGSFGISWIQLSLGQIQQTGPTLEAFNEVHDLGIFSYFSDAYLLSYGLNITDSLAVGLTGKYLTSNMQGIPGGQGSGYSVTPGILFTPNKELTIGAKLDEAVNRQNWRTGTTETVPPKLRVGIAAKIPWAQLTLSADITQVIRSTYRPESVFGAEWTPIDALSIRLGSTPQGLTGGIGFRKGHAEVDYAYVQQTALSRDNVHRISLTGRW